MDCVRLTVVMPMPKAEPRAILTRFFFCCVLGWVGLGDMRPQPKAKSKPRINRLEVQFRPFFFAFFFVFMGWRSVMMTSPKAKTNPRRSRTEEEHFGLLFVIFLWVALALRL